MAKLSIRAQIQLWKNKRKLQRYYEEHFMHPIGVDDGETYVIRFSPAGLTLCVMSGTLLLKAYILEEYELKAIEDFLAGKEIPKGKKEFDMVEIESFKPTPNAILEIRVYESSYEDKYYQNDDEYTVEEGIRFMKVLTFRDKVVGCDFITIPKPIATALTTELERIVTIND